MYRPMSSQVEHRDVHNVRIQIDVVTQRQEHPILTAALDITWQMFDEVYGLYHHMVESSQYQSVACHLSSISVGLSLGNSGRAVGQSSKRGLLRGGFDTAGSWIGVILTNFSSETILTTSYMAKSSSTLHFQTSISKHHFSRKFQYPII